MVGMSMAMFPIKGSQKILVSSSIQSPESGQGRPN
jgi:hypothetical protein